MSVQLVRRHNHFIFYKHKLIALRKQGVTFLFFMFSIFLFFYYFYLFIAVQILLSTFSCHHYPQPHSCPPPTLNPFPTLTLPMGPLYMFLDQLPLLYPIILLLPPLWLLSVCFLFQCLWLYFVCLFVLVIRFHLKVRSYGICVSPPGLFHLA